MTVGQKVSDKDALSGVDYLYAIYQGTSGKLSSTALGTVLAASGPIADAITGKAESADLTAATARIDALEAIGPTGAQYTTGGPVACATTANITLSGEQTIDGETTSTDRVLVMSQTDPAENGIYVSAAGAWSRATDMDAAGEVAGTSVYVRAGTANGLRTFVTYSSVETLGTDDIEFREADDASAFSAALALKAPLDSAEPTGDWDFAGANSLTVPDGTDDGHAVNKGQLDDAVAGATIDGVQTGVYGDESNPGDYEYAVIDANNAVALGVKEDGQTDIAKGYSPDFQAGSGRMTATGADEMAIADESGNVVLSVDRAGQIAMRAPFLIGPRAARYNTGAFLPADLLHMITGGQSNAQGNEYATGQSGTQEYGGQGINANNVPANTLQPLTHGNFGRSGTSENPTFGLHGFLFELLANENGITFDQLGSRFVHSNTGLAGATIAQLSDGGSSGKFERGLDHTDSLSDLAGAAGRSSGLGMVAWYQGESDQNASAYSTYLASLTALAEDYRSQFKTAHGATFDPVFVTWQLSQGSASTVVGVPKAQLDWANSCSFGYCFGPTYHIERQAADGTHFASDGYRHLGAYAALVFKRVVIDRVGWEPLQPVSAAVVGDSIVLTFNKRGLVFDTDTLPSQTNYGFTVKNGAGTAQTISSVEIIGDNRVRIECAATPDSGWTAYYGHQAMSGITGWQYTGPGGNLRDSAGDYLEYSVISQPMHNWCCLSQMEL